MSSLKVRPEPSSGQAVPDHEVVIPVPQLRYLEGLERQASAIGLDLEEWLLALLRANVRACRVDPPQAQMVLRLDTGTLRLLERHSTALGLSLAGLFWHVAGDIYTTPLSRLRELYAANSEPAEIAYALLVERGC
jgi:hypothetical protein